MESLDTLEKNILYNRLYTVLNVLGSLATYVQSAISNANLSLYCMIHNCLASKMHFSNSSDND